MLVPDVIIVRSVHFDGTDCAGEPVLLQLSLLHIAIQQHSPAEFFHHSRFCNFLNELHNYAILLSHSVIQDYRAELQKRNTRTAFILDKSDTLREPSRSLPFRETSVGITSVTLTVKFNLNTYRS